MALADVLFKAQVLLTNAIKEEHRAQGHYLTGTTENSITGKQTRNGTQYVLQGLAVSYALVLNKGLQPSEISYKVYPALVRYFQLRGFVEKDAKRIAGATIAKWKQEGMSTEASKRFSSTGERQNFIERGIEKSGIDNFMDVNLDQLVNEEFLKTKSEII